MWWSNYRLTEHMNEVCYSLIDLTDGDELLSNNE